MSCCTVLRFVRSLFLSFIAYNILVALNIGLYEFKQVQNVFIYLFIYLPIKSFTIQYNSIQFNSIQYNTSQYVII